MPDPVFVPAAAVEDSTPDPAEPVPESDPYRDELHAILEGTIGILRHMIAVTPTAGGQQAAAVSALWDRLGSLRKL